MPLVKLKKIKTAIRRVLLIAACSIGIHAFAEKINICSWNIASVDTDTAVRYIVNFVQASNIDILALQEVKVALSSRKGLNEKRLLGTNDFLDRLQAALNMTGGKWDFFSSADYAIRKNVNGLEFKQCARGQDNAVIYRLDKLQAGDLASTYKLTFA